MTPLLQSLLYRSTYSFSNFKRTVSVIIKSLYKSDCGEVNVGYLKVCCCIVPNDYNYKLTYTHNNGLYTTLRHGSAIKKIFVNIRKYVELVDQQKYTFKSFARSKINRL